MAKSDLKSYKNSGKEWSNKEINYLKANASKVPTGLLAWEFKRTKAAVYTKASDLGISLDPINRSPDKRHKK
jgi:hypothetical protein